MGPSAIRYAGLEERLTSFGCRVTDRGNLSVPEPEALAVRDPGARFLPEILDACAELAGLVTDVVGEGSLPLVLGGDHSVALGTLAGLREAAGQAGGVIWIDAHGDLNTPRTSPSGNVHGMPLAASLGLAGNGFAHGGLTLPAVDPQRVVLVGVRSLDPAERTLIRETGIRAITMTEIDRIGIERVAQEAIDRASGPGFVHVSLDLDALDPEVAPGVGTPVNGGLHLPRGAPRVRGHRGVGGRRLARARRGQPHSRSREHERRDRGRARRKRARPVDPMRWGNPWFPTGPLLRVVHGSTVTGLPAGKAGLRPRIGSDRTAIESRREVANAYTTPLPSHSALALRRAPARRRKSVRAGQPRRERSPVLRP